MSLGDLIYGSEAAQLGFRWPISSTKLISLMLFTDFYSCLFYNASESQNQCARPQQCPSSDARRFPRKSHTSLFSVHSWPSYRPHNGEVLKLQLPRNERSPPHTQIAWCVHMIKEPILFLGLRRGGLTVNGLGLSFHSVSKQADRLVWLSTRSLSLRVGTSLISCCGVTASFNPVVRVCWFRVEVSGQPWF